MKKLFLALFVTGLMMAAVSAASAQTFTLLDPRRASFGVRGGYAWHSFNNTNDATLAFDKEFLVGASFAYTLVSIPGGQGLHLVASTDYHMDNKFWSGAPYVGLHLTLWNGGRP